jgi:hypothetical protein
MYFHYGGRIHIELLMDRRIQNGFGMWTLLGGKAKSLHLH